MTPRVWRLRYSEVAARQVEEIVGWWAENRPRAPGLFPAELDRCLARLAVHPRVGASYALRSVRGLRRVLLRETRYHVYYSINATDGLIIVQSVWHAARGARPELG